MSSTLTCLAARFLSASLLVAGACNATPAQPPSHSGKVSVERASPIQDVAPAHRTTEEAQDGPKATAAQKALQEARAALLVGSQRKALSKYEEARSLYQLAGDRGGEALALSLIADTYNSLGEKQKSLDAYSQALAIYQAIADRSGEAAILNNLAFIYEEIGDSQKALEYCTQALMLLRVLGDKHGEATLLANTAFLHNSLGETEKSLDYYTRALELMRSTADRTGEARTLNNLGRVYESLGQKQKALEFFNQALVLWRETGDRRGQASTLNNIGSVYDALQQKEQSLNAYSEALQVTIASNNSSEEAVTLKDIFFGFTSADATKGLPDLSQALPLWQRVADREGAATTINNLAQVYYSLGQKEKTLALLQQALALWKAIGDREGEATTLENIANVYESAGDKQTASDFYAKAGALRYSLGELRRSAGKPTLHILSIGIGRYPRGPKTVRPSLKYPLWNIPAAIKDAHDFSDTLKTSAGDFEEVKTHLLVNSTKAQILEEFEKVIREVKPRDTFVFTYSGQGFSKTVARSGKREFYLMPADFNAGVGAPAAISTNLLLVLLTRIQAQRRFIVLDARESSAGFDRLSASIAEEGRTLAGLLQRDVALITLPEGPRINLVEGEGKNNGLLTYSLLKGMQGPADTDGNGVSVREAIEYARSYVKQRLPTIPDLDYYQKHVVVKSYVAGDDFPLTKGDVAQTPPVHAHVVHNTGNPRRASERYLEVEPLQGESPPRAVILGRTDTALSKAPRVRTGKDYALLIASDKYDKWPPLSNPIADAEAIEKKLKDYYAFETDVLRNPTKTEIYAALRKYKNKQDGYAADDQLFIFLAGHGTYNEEFRDGYIIGRDSLENNPDAEGYVSYSQLRNIIDQIPNQHIFLVIDACFGGTFNEWLARQRRGHHAQYQDAPNLEFIDRRMHYRTRRLLTSGGKEYVPDGRPGEHSPFASKLLEALETRGGKYGVLTLIDIVSYVQRVTPEPVTGEWGENEPRSDFLFIKKEKQLNAKP